MSKDPKVIEPAGYNMKKAAKKCGMHMGIFGCPICDQNFNDYGGMIVVECVSCNFQFPTDWWPVYASGATDGRRIAAAGAELSGGMKIRMDNPYYRTGFNTPDGEAWETRKGHDWRAITAGWKPERCKAHGMCGPYCERCGQLKDESRRNRSGECVKCESDTECRHRCSMMNKECKAGVNFEQLGMGQLGLGKSMPCYYVAGTIPIHCDKYERRTVEEVQAEDAEMDAHMARHMLVFPLVSRIAETCFSVVLEKHGGQCFHADTPMDAWEKAKAWLFAPDRTRPSQGAIDIDGVLAGKEEVPTLSEWLAGWEAAHDYGQSSISREEAERRYYKTYGRAGHQNGEG